MNDQEQAKKELGALQQGMAQLFKVIKLFLGLIVFLALALVAYTLYQNHQAKKAQAAGLGHTPTYITTDKYGNKTYTDRPTVGAKALDYPSLKVNFMKFTGQAPSEDTPQQQELKGLSKLDVIERMRRENAEGAAKIQAAKDKQMEDIINN